MTTFENCVPLKTHITKPKRRIINRRNHKLYIYIVCMFQIWNKKPVALSTMELTLWGRQWLVQQNSDFAHFTSNYHRICIFRPTFVIFLLSCGFHIYFNIIASQYTFPLLLVFFQFQILIDGGWNENILHMGNISILLDIKVYDHIKS